MARCDFSETQFVFGYFHHYLNLNGRKRLRFIIPTLRAEGNPTDPNCGADLVINGNLFLQFKISDYLKSKGSSEVSNGLLTEAFLPYYRFSVKNDDPTNQFDKLKQKALTLTNTVLYVAPLFSSETEFDDFISTNNSNAALNKVVQIDFSQFNTNGTVLSHTNDHKICYNTASIATNDAHLFSEHFNVQIQKGFKEIQFKENIVMVEKKMVMNTIKLTVNELKEDFKLDINENSKVSDVQNQLVSKYNIFWVPILNEDPKK